MSDKLFHETSDSLPGKASFRAGVTGRLAGLGLVSPALLIVLLFFILPLAGSVTASFRLDGGWGSGNFLKAWALYRSDILFTLGVVLLSVAMIAALSVAIGGYLTLGTNPRAVAMLRWLYRWPLFVPFIVVGQVLRAFLAKGGLMNGALVQTGLIEPMAAMSWYDWRGLVFAFVWKQVPFVTLLLAGAMASVDRHTLEAAQNMGAGRLRILIQILVPQVAPTLWTGLILSFVTIMSVLSVPLMINAQNPTMITANISHRIIAYGDYGVANALGTISLLMTAGFAWVYLRLNLRDKA